METFLLNLEQSINAFSWLVALTVLVAYFVVDALYAHYTLSVTELKPATSANTGALMHFLLALGVLSYVDNYLYIIPIAIGSWLGTYFLVARRLRKRNLILEA